MCRSSLLSVSSNLAIVFRPSPDLKYFSARRASVFVPEAAQGALYGDTYSLQAHNPAVSQVDPELCVESGTRIERFWLAMAVLWNVSAGEV